MTVKTITVKGKEELSIKRCYLNAQVKLTCPYCEAENERDFNDHYMSYPTTNEKEIEGHCCNECDEEFFYDVTLKIKLMVDTDTRKTQ